ncbi:MAG: iron-sulfur cluster assembly accessory protein [Desulfofustis sp.]|jgi:iron-sulfur cluster assembly protein|nr:iron-sulfur cluster assembly accessory protein [Desulfofustis sp.]
MITISDRARQELIRRGGKDRFVRIVVQSGGCAGMTYHAEIVPEKGTDEKIVWRSDQLTVITDDDSLPYLIGLQIDYSDDLITAGFRFRNGSSASSCGCGASFAADGTTILANAGGHGCGH